MSLELTGPYGTYQDIFDLGFGSQAGGLYGPYYNPYPYWRDNQLRGEALPFYLSEYELKVLRDRSRALVAGNEFAISALANRRNYVVGKGLVYRAVAVNESKPNEKMIQDVQKFMDLVRDINDFPCREAESCWRDDEDGDAFVRLFYRRTGSDAGMTYLRFAEPELVRSPTGDQASASSFGIKTRDDDVEDILGYYIVDDPLSKNSPSFVRESNIVHFKHNTRSSSKRGLPVLYAVEANLKRAEDLLTSMTSMAKTRAKIAMIRKMKSTRSAAQAMADELTEVTVTDPLTQTTRNMERLLPGTILTSDSQKEYEFPHAATAASEFVAVLDAELRAIASRLQMPEWMLSANAGNANYSSSFVAESGVVKAFEYLQDYYKRKWGEGRYGTNRSIMWRCIDNAIAVGILPEAVRDEVRILVEAPPLVVRDRDREASLNKLYSDMMVKSRQTIQQELGLDTAIEDKNIQEDPMREFKMAEAAKMAAIENPQPAGGEGDDSPTQRKQPPQQNWQAPQTRLAVTRNFSQIAESFPDVQQDDGISCGAACAMAVGKYFGVGPATLAEWKTLLGTEEVGYTVPEALVSTFESLGMNVKVALNEDNPDLPAICLTQKGDQGHYVVLLGRQIDGVRVMDPEEGLITVAEALWNQNWHDSDAEGKKYERYSIHISPKSLEK